MFGRNIRKSIIVAPVSLSRPVNVSYRQESGLCLKDKVVIVTGAGGGIGASAAIAFADQGSHVVLVDINGKNATKISKVCEEQHCAKTLCCQIDVTRGSELKAMIEQTIIKFGKIDVLVNNAGILTFGSLLKGDELMKEYDRTLATNLRASIYLTTLVVPHLVKTKGNVINISSILGCRYVGNSKYMPYCISKAGLDHFMYGAALELASHGIRVNNVCPGPTETEIFATAGVKGSFKDIGDSFKIGEMSKPEEIADLIVFLASAKARSITGCKYYIDRGTLLMG